MRFSREVLGRSEWQPFVDRAFADFPGGGKGWDHPPDNTTLHMGVLADRLADANDFREHLVRETLAAGPDIVKDRDKLKSLLGLGPGQEYHAEVSASADIPLPDGTTLALSGYRKRRTPLKRMKAVGVAWHARTSDALGRQVMGRRAEDGDNSFPVHFGGYYSPAEARALVDHMPDDVAAQVTAFLDRHFPPAE